MAKFLDYSGLKHIFEKRIGKKDISGIGDGTCTGAISALNQSNVKLSSNVNNMQQSMNNVSKEISNMDSSMLTLGNKVDSLNRTVNELGKKKNYLSDRFFVFVGDSYMYGYYPDNSDKKLTGYVDLAKARTGLNGNIYARGGEGFAKSGSYGNFLNRLKDFNGDKTKVTDVVVLGGYNDHDMSSSAISSAIKTFCDYVYSNFPIAKITIGVPSWSTSASVYNDIRRVLQTYINAASANKCAFITNLEYVMHNTDLLSSDGLHPNTEGHNKLSAALISWLLGGDVDVVYGYNAVTYTAGSGITISSTTFYSQLNNGICSLMHPECVGVGCSITQTWNAYHAGRIQVLTITGSTNIEGANFTSDVKSSPSSAQVTVASAALIDGKWQNCTMIIELISSALFVSIMAVNDGGYVSGKCTAFILPSFNIVAQSICA